MNKSSIKKLGKDVNSKFKLPVPGKTPKKTKSSVKGGVISFF